MSDRIGKGIRTAPRDALIASSVDESIRGKSYGFTGLWIAPGCDWASAGYCYTSDSVPGFGLNDSLLALRWTFILSIIPGTLAVITLVLFVKESPHKNRNGKPFTFSFKNIDKISGIIS